MIVGSRHEIPPLKFAFYDPALRPVQERFYCWGGTTTTYVISDPE
jgi:hypothetical protein